MCFSEKQNEFGFFLLNGLKTCTEEMPETGTCVADLSRVGLPFEEL